jgi:O-antigen biosynthesis protein WbqV
MNYENAYVHKPITFGVVMKGWALGLLRQRWWVDLPRRLISKVRSRLMLQLKSVNRAWHLYVADLALAAVAMFIAGFFRYGQELLLDSGAGRLQALGYSVLAFVLICTVVFPLTGLYRRNWSYASLSELFVVIRAAFMASLIFVSMMFLFTRLQLIPRSVVAIELLLLAPLLMVIRLKSRIGELPLFGSRPIRSLTRGNAGSVPVLLVGVCPAADLYLRALQTDPSSGYEPVGILDNSPDQHGLSLRGVPVLGALSDFELTFADLESQGKRPRHLIFAQPLMHHDEESVQKLIETAERLGIAVSRLSPATELRSANLVNRFELKTIELTDLLERPQKALDRAAIARLIFGCRVLITGAGGSIGSELVRQIAALGPSELILVDNSEYNLYQIDLELGETFPNVRRKAMICDVRDVARVNEIFDANHPELVFHAAALKHVPMVEMNPSEGILTNAIGTMNVAEAARRAKVRAMVQISTDKAVNTTSVMGASKRLAELYCQALDLDSAKTNATSRFMTVRFGNVLGSSGSLIPLFKRQISPGGPLTVTDPEMSRFFMTIREAVELTMQASAYGLQQGAGQGEIFVLDMGTPIKIIDIARRMIRLAGYTPDVDIKIRIIGRRPGEKLYEELFDSAEKRVESHVDGVLGAIPAPFPLKTLREAFARISDAASEGNEEALFASVGQLLPDYYRETSGGRSTTTVPRQRTPVDGKAAMVEGPGQIAS